MLKQQKNTTDNAVYLLIIFGCCLIAYWPLSLNVYSLKNDALNYFLPVRYQISEAISNGYWPFWSPYFNLGYPLHGDMQSGVWNPFVQLFSLFGSYTLKMLQYETLLYVYLSGVGMFYFLRHFNVEKRLCLIGAVSFMLCGYNSDSAQFLNWISSASFIPFVLLFYFKTLTHQNWRNAVYCAFFLWLLFTTAYPADFIILCYMLIATFIWYIVKTKGYKNKKQIIAHSNTHFIIGICFLLLALPAIISFSQFLGHSERGSGTSFSEAVSNSLHPLLLFSYITPLGVWKAPNVGITDPLERNSFMGIVIFAVLIFSFLIKTKNSFFHFCKWAVVLFTIFSFGEMGGLRTIAYYTLPLMNAFRHPANAKIFTLFFATVLSMLALKEANTNQFYKNRKYAFGILLLLVVVLFIWAITGPISLFHLPNKSYQSVGSTLKFIIDHLTFSDLILINIFVQIPFLILLYYYFVKKVVLKRLVIASLLNCVLHTMLFQPFTVVKKDKANAIQTILNDVRVPGYPLPDAANNPAENSENGNQHFDAIGPANMYNKKIGRINYRITPSNLNWQNDFWFNTKIRNIIFNFPLVYAADTAVYISDSARIVSTNKRLVFLKDTNDISLVNKNANFDSGMVRFTRFSPNGWDIEIINNKPAFYTIAQSYYPRWQAKIDGKKVSILQSNISFMGFYVPAGKHYVAFNYAANDIKIAFLISILSALVIICFGFYSLLLFRKKTADS